MSGSRTKWIALLTGLSLALALPAQEANPTQKDTSPDSNPSGSVPIYKLNVVSRTVRAINYHHRQGFTSIDFRGTELMPRAEGSARVESNIGSTKIEADFRQMRPAQEFGSEFLTYVLWAITPEGRAQNLGEVRLDGDHANLLATTELQSFGMIVTAEPYFAVTQPSDVVVMENFVRKDTTGTFEYVDAKYQLLRRGSYVRTVEPSDVEPVKRGNTIPLELQEAHNALAIARAAGADWYAKDTLQKALLDYQNAADFYSSGSNEKKVQTLAREATQLSEDARLISIRTHREQQQAQLKSETQEARQAVQQARARADRADQERQQAQANEVAARMEAQAARQRQARSEDQPVSVTSPRATDGQGRLESDRQRTRLRSELRRLLNGVYETRETARGFIMTMPDASFGAGDYSLRPEAREKLAKLSGMFLAHPDLKMDVIGYPDNNGNQKSNQELSEYRAKAVRAYLISQGISSYDVNVNGFDASHAVAPEVSHASRGVEVVVTEGSIESELSEELSQLRTQ